MVFVTTLNGEKPTPENSTPLDQSGDGRGSLVFFNEASMFASELNLQSLKEGKDMGMDTSKSFEEVANEAMVIVK